MRCDIFAASKRILAGLIVRTALIAPVGIALGLLYGAPLMASTPSVDVVASTHRELPVRQETSSQILQIEFVDPDSRFAKGLGDGASRAPVASYDRSLCALTTNPGLHPDMLIPASVADAPAGASVAEQACGPDEAGVGRQLFDPSVFAASVIPATQWSPQDAGVLPVAPTSRADTGIGLDGELSSHPGLIQQPKLVKQQGDRLSYSVTPDTAVGFDGKILRVRLKYPKIQGN